MTEELEIHYFMLKYLKTPILCNRRRKSGVQPDSVGPSICVLTAFVFSFTGHHRCKWMV